MSLRATVHMREPTAASLRPKRQEASSPPPSLPPPWQVRKWRLRRGNDLLPGTWPVRDRAGIHNRQPDFKAPLSKWRCVYD